MIAIGIMSGTSLDGIDVAIIDINENDFKTIGFITVPYQEEIKNKILECSDLEKSNVQKICSLNVEVSYLYVDAIKEALTKYEVDILDVSFIAMHGQTIWHNPNQMDGYYSSTLQIGDPSVVAYAFNKDVVVDMIAKFGEDMDEDMVLVINAQHLAALRKDEAFVHVMNGQTIMNGEIGQIFGARVVVSNKVQPSEAFLVKAGAVEILMKRNVMVEAVRDIKKKINTFVADEHYVVYLRDESKIVKATIA